MIFKCQRKTSLDHKGHIEWHIHRVEAPDEGTARIMMFNRSFSWLWLDLDKTDVWPAEDWIAT